MPEFSVFKACFWSRNRENCRSKIRCSKTPLRVIQILHNDMCRRIAAGQIQSHGTNILRAISNEDFVCNFHELYTFVVEAAFHCMANNTHYFGEEKSVFLESGQPQNLLFMNAFTELFCLYYLLYSVLFQLIIFYS